MSISILNGTAGTGDRAEAHPDMSGSPSSPVLPDMQSAPRSTVTYWQAKDLNPVHSESESSPAVCSASSRPEEETGRRRCPDMQLGGIGTNGQTTERGEVDHWTISERLDFVILWRAIELTTAEIAAHFGLSQRHLQRLRADFGLDIRPALRRLDRAARKRLVAFEEWAAFMTPRGLALLKVAQGRRQAA